MTKEEIILANKEFLFPSVFHYYKEPLVISHAKDQYVWDADGNRFTDYVLAYGPHILGHAPPEVVSAISEQLSRGTAYGLTTEVEEMRDIHGVHHVFHPPVALREWPDADRRSRIVFITRGIARASSSRAGRE